MKYERKMLSAGMYEAVCVAAMETYSKSGSEMIEMKWNVEGVEIKSYLTPKMGWIIDQIKSACGMVVDGNNDAEIMASDLIGKKALVEVTVDSYNNMPSNKINKYLPSMNPVTIKEEAPF